MLVWSDGQSGTIGGGALEYDATTRARSALNGLNRLDKIPLGPSLGQCCGGAVTLLTETFDAASLPKDNRVYLRPLPGPKGDAPHGLADRAVNGPVTANGWIAEPTAPQGMPLWIYGAGHVGRAIVATLSPLPDWSITWIDIAPDRYPDPVPPRVTQLYANDPAALVPHAPIKAAHLILTHSHDLDLALCDALLRRHFAAAGLIGSATKWARFQSRLRALGHPQATIDRITCPIGSPDLGKHPQAIAIGVAAGLLHRGQQDTNIAAFQP